MKDIINEVGNGLLTNEILEVLINHIFDMYAKSDERIKENNSMAKKTDEDEEVDEDEVKDD